MKCTLMVRFYFLSIILFTSTFGQASGANVKLHTQVSSDYLETAEVFSIIDPDGTTGPLRISLRSSLSLGQVHLNHKSKKKLFLFGHDHSKAAETAEFYLFLLHRLLEKEQGEKVVVFLEGFSFDEFSQRIEFSDLVTHDLRKHEILRPEEMRALPLGVEMLRNDKQLIMDLLGLSMREWLKASLSGEKKVLLDSIICVIGFLAKKKLLQDLEFVGWETDQTIAAPFESCPLSKKVKVLRSMNESYATTLEWFAHVQETSSLGIWRSGLGHLPLWDAYKYLEHEKVHKTSFYQKNESEIDNIFCQGDSSFDDISAFSLLKREGIQIPTSIIQNKITSFSEVMYYFVFPDKYSPRDVFVAQEVRKENRARRKARLLVKTDVRSSHRAVSSPDRKGRSASQEDIDTTSAPRRKTCWECLFGERVKYAHAE